MKIKSMLNALKQLRNEQEAMCKSYSDCRSCPCLLDGGYCETKLAIKEMTRIIRKYRKEVKEIMQHKNKNVRKEVSMSKNKTNKREIQENLEQDYYNEPVMNIPEGCAACGGPYPDCKWSCPMFDD